jgi:hypothetical protein
MKKTAVAILSILFLTVFAQADTYIKQKTHTDGFSMMGQQQPPKDDTIEQWIGDNQMATITGHQAVIVDLTKSVVLMVNNRNKSYVEMTLPLDMSKYLPAQMAQMMGATKVTVTPNGQTQQVGEWQCDGYDMTMDMMMMKLNSKIWASKTVSFDWQGMAEKLMPLVMQASMRLNDESLQELAKIKGVQIKSETSMEMMGTAVKMSQEVLEISTKPAPAGVYTVPADYTKKDQFSMEDMMGR